ncbi:hypothetical protein SBA4_4260007 [Candidatus Sulfopaludibacter sp. SbA4]|nr:hypothetical protein SBA4_4260007 [Candidatus Sulfopaludibacter sp. SbA4]
MPRERLTPLSPSFGKRVRRHPPRGGAGAPVCGSVPNFAGLLAMLASEPGWLASHASLRARVSCGGGDLG